MQARSELVRWASIALVFGLVAAVGCESTSPAEDPRATSEDLTAAIVLFPTAVDNANAALAIGSVDPHYAVTATTDTNYPAPPARSAFVSSKNAAWATPTAPAAWISLNNHQCNGAPGSTCQSATFDYVTTFTLAAGTHPATATVTLTVLADDDVNIRLNGTVVGNFTAAYGAANTLTIPPGSAFNANPTLNTLTFHVTNSGGGPTALAVYAISGSAKGCTLDNQCTGAQFCDTQALACTAKITNSSAIPTVTGHAPPLTGVCSAAVGTAVCVSTVCSTVDNKCGFANGDGPCTVANGPTRCRSLTCDAIAGVCIPPGGCAVDSECTAAQFCNTATFTCATKLANGTTVPTIAGHTPPLTGVCSGAVGMSVCQALACDTADNKCGFANGDGACTGATGAAVCRSGVCGGDLACGYPNGGGPCTVANQGTVCRSGVCSPTLGACIPAGGCTVDAECSGAQFCNTQTFTCTPKIGSGALVPTITGHTPPLTGTCSVAVGTAVCVATVCDTADNRCGYANGDGACNAGNAGTVCRSAVCGSDGACGLPLNEGPCAPGNAGTVCRSGACSVVGVCISPGGCAVDVECGAAQFCNTQTHSCTPKIANGNPVPTIGGHNPVLTGTCTLVVGAVVCQSGVCDRDDNKCGFADGDGPCTLEAGIVCRSGTCGDDGKCGTRDAGVPDAGLEDAGGSDAGPGADASPEADGSMTTLLDDGSLEGGGLSCAMGHVGFSGWSLSGLILAFGAIVRRRARRSDRSLP